MIFRKAPTLRAQGRAGVGEAFPLDSLASRLGFTEAIAPWKTNSRSENSDMTISIGHLQPIISLIAGVLILIMPRLLNYIVAAFLILSGVLGMGLLR